MYWLGWQWRRAIQALWQSPRSTNTSSKRTPCRVGLKEGGANGIFMSSNAGRNFLISSFLLQKDGRSVTLIKWQCLLCDKHNHIILHSYIASTLAYTQSSIRHSLSFGQCFRKVERKGGYQPMKGLHWELVPDKKAALEKEMETFLLAEGRGLIANTDALSDLQCICE